MIQEMLTNYNEKYSCLSPSPSRFTLESKFITLYLGQAYISPKSIAFPPSPPIPNNF